MKHTYIPRGVCATRLEFELEGDVVKNIIFHGGCNGGLKAVSTLLDGMTVKEITEKLEDNTCGMKSTSCAQQLTVALNKAISEKQEK
jgi:uncharacterized protein (TIGR03905 family)